jgi:plasmid stabilization system protein ParE
MALKIFWTKRALNSFNEILEYLQTEFGESSAKMFAIRVHNFVENLQHFPQLGTLQPTEKEYEDL